MKKVILSSLVIIVFGAYAIFHQNTQTAVLVPKNNSNSSQNSKTVNGTSYKDGTYTGAAKDAFYGTVQIKAVVQNGKLTDVQFLQFPNDQSESQQVSQMAMPSLKQEAIQAQNAQVDTVSGATQTSQAFKESLADALSQAR